MTILTYDMLRRAIADPKFFEALPEFRNFEGRLAGISTSASGGCVSCKQKRILVSVFREFADMVTRMSDERVAILKKYFNIAKLGINTLDAKTGAYKFIQR